MDPQLKGTYHEDNLSCILGEAIPRLTNIGILPKTVNHTIEGVSRNLRQKEDYQELNVPLFSPLETLIIGHDIFKKLALEKAKRILNLIRNPFNQYIPKLFAKFETLSLEIYYFNEFLPEEYKINFDEPWQEYQHLKNIPLTQAA
ncbi:MAG: hypothetical protein V1663_04610 [archaeon]